MSEPNEFIHDEMQAAELRQFKNLAVAAPPTVFHRFRRRAGLMQGSRLLVESQVSGFWLVLDTFLKHFFRAVPLEPDHHTAPLPSQISGEKA